MSTRPSHFPIGGVRRDASESGIALMVVLLLALILIPFAGEFAYQIHLEAMSAGNVTDQLAIENAIDGQFEIVLARIEFDAPNNETDSYDDAWNDDKIQKRQDDETNVDLTTTMFDEQGKFNLNMLGTGSNERRALWKQRLAELIRLYRQDTKWDATGLADELAEDIFRWVNSDTSRGNIPKPKLINDQPMLHLEELYFINDKFEKEELLYDRREGEEIAPGLHRYLTVYGTGKINLNTADKVVLKAIFFQDPDVADRIVEKREGQSLEEDPDAEEMDPESAEGSGDPFTDVQQVAELDGVTPLLLTNNKVDLGQDFDVRTNYFGIRILGTTDLTARDEFFVVERVPSSDPNAGLDGFRFLLHEERTDTLEDVSAIEDQ